MRKRKLRKFTREQVKALAANPYTSRVDFHSIWYTDEFMMLFLERYKNGDTSYEIFSSCGYDIEVLGENRVYGFPRRVAKLLGISRGLTGPDGKTTDPGAMPTLQTVFEIQQELECLRRQIQFLKKTAGAEGLEGLDSPATVPTE